RCRWALVAPRRAIANQERKRKQSPKCGRVVRSVDEHVAAAIALVTRLSAVVAPVPDALGLVLAEGVTAQVDSPPFDNSAMDGFAVRRADVERATGGSPVSLRVAGE